MTDEQAKKNFKAKLDAAFDNPKATKAKIRAKVKRENPGMTEEQLDAGDDLLRAVFGL